jgi:hypothetical protein
LSEFSQKADLLEFEAAKIFDRVIHIGPSAGNEVSRDAARFVDCIVMASVLRIMEKQAEDELCRAQSQNP